MGGRFNATVYTLHNLNSQFATLSGNIGRVDAYAMEDATVNIIGDGRVLQTHNLKAGDLPIDFALSVAGVNLLRIEFILTATGAWVGYALVGFLE